MARYNPGDYPDLQSSVPGFSQEEETRPSIGGESYPEYRQRLDVEDAVTAHNAEVDAYKAQQAEIKQQREQEADLERQQREQARQQRAQEVEQRRAEHERASEQRAREAAIRQNESISGAALKATEGAINDTLPAEASAATNNTTVAQTELDKTRLKAGERTWFGLPFISKPTDEAQAAQAQLPTQQKAVEDAQAREKQIADQIEEKKRDWMRIKPIHDRDAALADQLDATVYARNQDRLRQAGFVDDSQPGVTPSATQSGPASSVPASTPQAPSLGQTSGQPAPLTQQPFANLPSSSQVSPAGGPAPSVSPVSGGTAAPASPSSPTDPTASLPLDTKTWTPENRATWKGLDVAQKRTFIARGQQAVQDKMDASRLLASMKSTLAAQDGISEDAAGDKITTLDQDSLNRLMRQSAVKEFGDNWWTNNSLIRGVAQGMLGVAKTGLDFTRIFSDSPEKQATSQMLDRASESIPQNVESYRQIRNAGDVLDYGANAIGQLVPSMALSLGAGAAVGAGLKAIPAVAEIATGAQTAGRLASMAEAAGNTARAAQLAAKAEKLAKLSALVDASGSLVGAFVPSYVQEAGSIYGQSEKAGHGNVAAALGFGAIAAALDSIEPARVIGRLATKGTEAEIKAAASASLKQYLVNVGKAAIKDGLVEGGTEGLQNVVEMAGQAASNNSWGETFRDPKNWHATADSFLMGLIGGVGLGGLSSVSEQNSANREKLVQQAAIDIAAKKVGSRNLDAVYSDIADRVNSADQAKYEPGSLPPASGQTVKFAAELDPGAPTTELTAAESEFRDAQESVARARDAVEQRGALTRDTSAVDAAYDRLEKATASLDAQHRALIGRMASSEVGSNSDFQRALTIARETERFPDVQEIGKSGEPVGVPQRLIARTIARIAAGIPASAADLNIRGANGDKIFHQDKDGRISLVNPGTQASLEQDAPTLAAAWKDYETRPLPGAAPQGQPAPSQGTQPAAPASESGNANVTGGGDTANRGAEHQRFAELTPAELSTKPITELRQIAQQRGVVVDVPAGEPPLTGHEVIERILAQQGQGTQVPAAAQVENPEMQAPPQAEPTYAPRPWSALSQEIADHIARGGTAMNDIERESVSRAAQILHERLPRWRTLFPRVQFELDGKGTAGMRLNPQSGHLTISVRDLLADIGNKDAALLDHRFLEEFIHFSAIRAKVNAAGLFLALPRRLREQIADAYPAAKSDFQRGHEFLRMIVQSRVKVGLDGTLTWDDAGGHPVTENLTDRAARAIRETAEKLVRYFQNLAANLRADGTKSEAADAVESAVRAIRKAMTPALVEEPQGGTTSRRGVPASPENEARAGDAVSRTDAATTPKNDNDNLQFTIPDPVRREILNFGARIPDAELYTGEGGADSFGGSGYGREHDTHVTVLYGPNAAPAEIAKSVAGVGPVKVMLGKVSTFSNPESPYDVVKVDVVSPKLHALHEQLKSEFGTASTFPDYKPHITIAYVKKGEGAKYVGKADFTGKVIELHELDHSDKDSIRTSIPLSASPQATNSVVSRETPSAETQAAAEPASRTLREAIQNKDRVIFHGMPGFLRMEPDGTVSFRREKTQELYEVAPALRNQTLDQIESLALDRKGQARTNAAPPEQLPLLSQPLGPQFDENQPIRDFLNGPEIASVSGNPIQVREGEKPIAAAIRWMQANGPFRLLRAGLGEVVISRAGVKSSLGHGFSGPKLSALTLVPDVIDRGVEIHRSPDWENPKVDHIFLAAPVSVDGRRHVMFVRLKQDMAQPAGVDGAKPRFHVHEVLLEDSLKKNEPDSFKTAPNSASGGRDSGGTGFMVKLYRELMAGKSEGPAEGAPQSPQDDLASQPLSSSPEKADIEFTEEASGTNSPGVAERVMRIVKRQIIPNGLVPAEAAAVLREAKLTKLYVNKMAQDWAGLLNTGENSELLDLQVPHGMMTQENKRLLYDVLIGGRKIEDLPMALRPVAERARASIDSLGERAVKAGLLNPETFTRNKGTYLPRFYLSKERDERGMMGLGRKLRRMLLDRTGNPRLSDAYAIITPSGRPVNHSPGRFRFDNALERDAFYDQMQRKWVLAALREQGGVGKIAESDITDSSRLAQSLQDRIVRLKEAFADKYEKNDPWSEEALDRMGLIREPAYPVGKAMLQLGHDITMANLFNQLALNPEWVTNQAVHGFEQIPDNPRWGKLAGKYVHEDIARELNEMASAPSVAWEFYNGLLATWKKWKTVYNPATHGRNMLGNILFADWSGTNPLNPLNARFYGQAVALLRGRKAGGVTVDELYRHGILGTDFTSQEIQKALDGVGADITPENISRRIWNLVSVKWARDFAQKAYQVEDTVFKTAAYVKARNRGMSPDEAAAHVRKWFPSYENLPTSPTMKALKVVMPFSSFFYEATRIGANAAREKPLRLAMAMALPSLITLYSLMRLGLDDKDRDDVLAQMRGRIGGWPIFSALMPWTDANGLPVQFDMTNIIPYAQPLGLRLDRKDSDPPLWEDIVRTFLTSNPITNIAVGLATNQDPFTGRELRVASQTPMQELRDVGGFVAKTVAPPLTPMVGTTWQTITAPQVQRGTLQKRDESQAVARGLAGIDFRTAAPSLYDAISEFQKENGYSERPERIGETAVSRSKSRLYDALINENLPAIAQELRYLDSQNVPLKTADDVQKWLSYRNPITGTGRIKKDDVPAFIRSLGPMQRAQVGRTMVEYNRIVATAPRVMARARARLR
jgi:hypothetical protein